MRKIGQFIDSINEGLGKAVSFFLLFIMIVVLIHVVSRYVIGRPTIWAWDVNRYLFGTLILLGAGYHILHRQVITVDILYSRFPPKLKAIADLISYIAILIFCITVIWKGGESAWRSFLMRETSTSVFAPPLYPLRMLLPIGAFLILLQSGRQFIHEFVATFTKGGEKRGN